LFQRELLKGRAIFLTGGGPGLGRSMALRFAELGARMFLVGRRERAASRNVPTKFTVRVAPLPLPPATCATTAPWKRPPQKAEEQFGENQCARQQRRGKFHGPNGKAHAQRVQRGRRNRAQRTFNCTQVFGNALDLAKLGGSVLNIVTTYARQIAARDSCPVGLRQSRRGWR